jgi:hypothetical protein
MLFFQEVLKPIRDRFCEKGLHQIESRKEVLVQLLSLHRLRLRITPRGGCFAKVNEWSSTILKTLIPLSRTSEQATTNFTFLLFTTKLVFILSQEENEA